MLLPAPEITPSARPGMGNSLLSGLPSNAPSGTGGGGMLPAVLVSNPNQVPGPPPPPPPKPKVSSPLRPSLLGSKLQVADAQSTPRSPTCSRRSTTSGTRTRTRSCKRSTSSTRTRRWAASAARRRPSRRLSASRVRRRLLCDGCQGAVKELLTDPGRPSVDWVSSSPATKESYLRRALGELSSSDSSERIAAASALCYVLSGASVRPRRRLSRRRALTADSALGPRAPRRELEGGDGPGTPAAPAHDQLDPPTRPRRPRADPRQPRRCRAGPFGPPVRQLVLWLEVEEPPLTPDAGFAPTARARTTATTTPATRPPRRSRRSIRSSASLSRWSSS